MVSGAFCFGEAWNGNSKGIRFAEVSSHFAKSFRLAKTWELQFWESSTIPQDGGLVPSNRSTNAGSQICCCSYLRSSRSSWTLATVAIQRKHMESEVPAGFER